MRRRDFVKGAVVAAAVPEALLGQATTSMAKAGTPAPGPVPWTLGLNARTPVPPTEIAEEVAQTDLCFFSPAQMATLRRLSDLLMPALGGNPGAVEANTPEFLDFYLVDALPVRQQQYRGGLDWLDHEAQTKYSGTFASLDNEKADKLVRPWLKAWMPDHLPTQAHADFINRAHDDIRNATANSDAWNKHPARTGMDKQSAGLYWSPIQPDIYGEGSERLPMVSAVSRTKTSR